MQYRTDIGTWEEVLENDIDSQEESIPINYKTSKESLEEICLDRGKQHIKGLRAMTVGLSETALGAVELGTNAIPVYVLVRSVGRLDPEIIALAFGGGLVFMSYTVKQGLQNISTGIHYTLDAITSRLMQQQSVAGTAYFVKDRYTNNPTWWDTRSGIRVKPFENASDFLFPNAEAYMFVNGLRIMSSETTKGHKGFFRHNRYTTVVEADLKDHTLNLNIHHRNRQLIADIAMPGNPAFYFMGNLSYKPDGYHLDLKDYGFALH